MATIVEDLLPASYYSSTLLGKIFGQTSTIEIINYCLLSLFIGIQADQKVLRTLVTNFLPDIDHVLVQHDIELSLISLYWFLTLFASVVHMKILLRIWDMFLFDGSIVLFQITLGMLKIKGIYVYILLYLLLIDKWDYISLLSLNIFFLETDLKQLENSAQIFNALSDIPGDIDDVDQLFNVCILIKFVYILR